MARNALLILWPVLGYIGWVCLLYVWLTYERTKAVKAGEADNSCFVTNEGEPKAAARIRRNLANQFELPLLFFFAVAVLIALHRVNAFDIAAAWVFLAGRILHTGVHTLTDNVTLRGRVFVINFLAVCALVGHLALLALEAL